MDSTSLLASSVGCTVDVDDYVPEVVDEVTGTAVANGTFGAKSSARVEGTTVVTMGITVGFSYVFLVSLSWTSLSIWISISFICPVNCRIKFIISSF